MNGGIHDALTTIREPYMTVLNKNSKMEDKSEVGKQLSSEMADTVIHTT